jgi:hypothetical protein
MALLSLYQVSAGQADTLFVPWKTGFPVLQERRGAPKREGWEGLKRRADKKTKKRD